MLPIIDYGGIAVVVPKIAAVGSVEKEDDVFVMEIYLSGIEEPMAVSFHSKEEGDMAREDLIAIVAQYHYVRELGPDFDPEEISDMFEQDGDAGDEGDTH